MFKLVIQDDEGKTTVVPLIRDEITIGRKEGNTIRLTERNVSRRHARILRNNGEVHIEDLGSYNGIRVNNSRIAERVSLRVSDQVQIGDYKLYLKAEGLEQVDDARTMPIERVDDAATDVINAVAPPATAQMPAVVSQVSATAPTAQTLITPVPPANLVGSPNRTLVAIADTDPAGRPVATAAAVAALSPPIGHGKLVVLSSNFAGKEFELTRPQMIIGRTDENDLVINHRSISRNHAKLVREHETGRYTISDLQSSNGVRVNGQDYGKVELRRGDVIDLGHVRLRYVEPGEDFVFARDAVITDVPDVDNKRNLWVAIALGVLVLGAVGGFFYWRSTGDDPHPKNNNGAGNGTNTMAMIDAASQVAIVESVDAAMTAIAPPPITIDAGVVAVSEDDKGRKYTTCLQLKTDQNWNLLQTCIDDLKRMGDATRANELGSSLTRELKARNQLDELKKLIQQKSYPKAKIAFFRIEDESSYHPEAVKAFEPFEQSVIADLQNRVKGPLARHECATVNQIYDEATKLGSAVEAQVKRSKCVEAVIADKTPHDPPLKDPKNPGPGSNAPVCNADDLKKSGDDNANSGLDSQSLNAYEHAFQCRADSGLIRLMFMESCRLKNAEKAHKYWKMVAPAQKDGTLRSICVRNGITDLP